MWVRLPHQRLSPGSSKGKTNGFEPLNVGSTPSPGTNDPVYIGGMKCMGCRAYRAPQYAGTLCQSCFMHRAKLLKARLGAQGVMRSRTWCEEVLEDLAEYLLQLARAFQRDVRFLEVDVAKAVARAEGFDLTLAEEAEQVTAADLDQIFRSV